MEVLEGIWGRAITFAFLPQIRDKHGRGQGQIALLLERQEGGWYKEVVSTHPILICFLLGKEAIFFAEVHLARNDVCRARKSPLDC